METTTAAVHIARQGPVRVVTLNRPNTVDGPTAEAQRSASIEFESRPELNVAALAAMELLGKPMVPTDRCLISKEYGVVLTRRGV
ncbi:hypothetical protein SAMN04488540_11187 [Ferrimonas sediminum]|uniref:Uncharacterized protein n=1 Tax=Ferrimonas sediminum TaxID=718193 RepID=A0A1G8VLH3_9GAMM|nr:hypothetical protein [Ferrimonas sediminum]SDJ66823.1 hypothetical protein SAMN04488540_11187 [Ferrimonas sediminum]